MYCPISSLSLPCNHNLSHCLLPYPSLFSCPTHSHTNILLPPRLCLLASGAAFSQHAHSSLYWSHSGGETLGSCMHTLTRLHTLPHLLVRFHTDPTFADTRTHSFTCIPTCLPLRMRAPPFWLPRVLELQTLWCDPFYCSRIELEWCCDLLCHSSPSKKAFRNWNEWHTVDWLHYRFTASNFPSLQQPFLITFPSCLASHHSFFSFSFFFFLLSLALQDSVTLCLSLTSDTCFDLAQSCSLRAL